MTKKLTKVAMTTALAAAAIVPAVVATPAQAAEAEVTFAKAYYTTANGTAAFEAGKLAGVIGATSNTKVTYAEGSNGEVFPMSAFSAYLAVNPTATTDEVLTALSTAGKALSADQVKALDVKEGQVEGGKVTVDPTAVVKTALEEAIAKAEASPKAAELKNAIATAKAVAENPDATQAEVDAAVKALNEAIAKAEAADKTALEEAIAKAEASPKAAELKDAIAEAKAVAEKADATQAEVDEAVKALNEAIAEAEAVKELKVESVKAINDTVKKAADQQLGFTINNGKEVTVAELEEAGYTVEFKYNKKALTAVDGKIDASNLAFDKFEYQVVVTPEEGDAITSDWKEVKVVDASAAVKVTKVALVDEDGNEWKQSILDGKVTFDAAEYENVLGEKNTDKENPFDSDGKAKPQVESASSSDITTAYYKDGKIVVLQDGEVTFDVKFKDIEETVKVPVTVKAEQKPASITTETTKVTAAVESKVNFTVLDKDGEVYQGTEKVHVTTKAAGKEESATAETNLTKGIGEVKHTFAKGETVVTVYADAAKKEKLGSFTINAIDTNKNPDKYTLALAEDEKAVLDLNVEADQAEVTLDAKAFVEDVAVTLPAEEDYKIDVKSSNDNIEATLAEDGSGTVTVKVKEGAKVKAGDTADIQLVLKEGAKETKVGDVVTIEVKNSTKQVETLTLKKDTKVKVAKGDSDLKGAVVAAIVEGEGENAVTADMIEKVTYVASNNAVIVKVAAIHGGKTFTLAAEYVEDATLKSAVYVKAEEAQTEQIEAKAATGEITASDVLNTDAKVVIGESTFTYDETATEDTEGLKYKDAAGLVALINADSTALEIVTAEVQDDKIVLTTVMKSAEANNTVVTYNDNKSVAFKGGAAETIEEKTPATPATLTFTFSEAVTLDGDFSFTIGEEEATTGTAVVDEKDATKVVVTLAEGVEVKVNDTITAITGLKTAKGSVVVPTGNDVVKVTSK